MSCIFYCINKHAKSHYIATKNSKTVAILIKFCDYDQ